MSGFLVRRLPWLFGRTVPPQEPAQAEAVVASPEISAEVPRSSPVAICHVRSSRGVWVSLADGGVVASPILDPAYALLLLRAEALPNAALLVAPGVQVFGVMGDLLRASVSSARVLQTNVAGAVRLKYPVGGASFLTTAPHPDTRVRFDGSGETMEAVFTLVPVADAHIPSPIRTMAAAFGALAGAGLRADSLLDALRRGAIGAALVPALLRLLPEEELDALGRVLVADKAMLAAMRRAMPEDVWLTRHLPALAGWVEAGRPPVPGHRMVAPAEDEAELLALERGRASAGLALTACARRQIPPRKLACVLATARNEGPYLLDWVSYHLSIGFEHVFLYTNENDDGSGPLLEALARGGAITLIDNMRGPDMGPQPKAYAHALTILPQILDFRWTAILDIDEYLAFDTNLFGGIADLIGLQECQSCDAIALCWLFFAAQPGEFWSDESTLARFTRRERDVNSHVKSLFRTRLFCRSQPHFPYATMERPFHYRTQDGRAHHNSGAQGVAYAFAEHPGAEQAWINHYFLRTADEALWKWSRGRADWPQGPQDTRRDEFLSLVSESFMNLGRPERLVEDRRILACARGQGAVLDRLRGLPGVAEAERAARLGFGARLRAHTAEFLALPVPEGAPEAWTRFRDVLASVQY